MHQNTRRFFTSTLVLLSIIPLAGFEGCRFGNRVEKPAPAPNPDDISGFYNTRATELSFASGLTEMGSVDTVVSADVSLVPTRFSNTLTQPTFISLDSLESLEGVFAPNTLKAPLLPLQLLPDKKTIEFSKLVSQGAAWTTDPQDPHFEEGCITAVYLQFDGTLAKAEGLGTFSTSSGPQPIIGNMELIAQYWRLFEGCTQTLAFMEQCYLDELQCGYADPAINHATHLGLKSFFGAYVASGAILESDISEVKTLAYEVAYSSAP